MCKPNESIEKTISELMEIRAMIEELEEEAEGLTDTIKAFMADEETLVCGPWKITYRETVSKRIDSALLQMDLGADALEGYYKTMVSRPFRIQ